MKFASVLHLCCPVIGLIVAVSVPDDAAGYPRLSPGLGAGRILIPPLAPVYVVGAWLYTRITTRRAEKKYAISPPLPATVSWEKRAVPA